MKQSENKTWGHTSLRKHEANNVVSYIVTDSWKWKSDKAYSKLGKTLQGSIIWEICCCGAVVYTPAWPNVNFSPKKCSCMNKVWDDVEKKSSNVQMVWK